MDQIGINNYYDGSDCVVACTGVLDDYLCEFFLDYLAPAVEFSETVIVDLTRVAFVDALILQNLVLASRELEGRGGRLQVLIAEGSHPAQVIERTGLDRVLDVQVEALYLDDLSLEFRVFSRWTD